MGNICSSVSHCDNLRIKENETIDNRAKAIEDGISCDYKKSSIIIKAKSSNTINDGVLVKKSKSSGISNILELTQKYKSSVKNIEMDPSVNILNFLSFICLMFFFLKGFN